MMFSIVENNFLAMLSRIFYLSFHRLTDISIDIYNINTIA